MNKAKILITVVALMVIIAVISGCIFIEQQKTERKVEFLKMQDKYTIEYMTAYIKYAGPIKNMINANEIANYSVESDFKKGTVEMKEILDKAEKKSKEYNHWNSYTWKRGQIKNLVALTIACETYRKAENKQYYMEGIDEEINFSDFGLSNNDIDTIRNNQEKTTFALILNLQKQIAENVDQYNKDMPMIVERLNNPNTPYEKMKPL